MGKTNDGQAPDRLTDQQREFCEEFSKHFNATLAAKQAKYTHPDRQGPRLLTNPAVIEYLAGIKKQVAKKHAIDRDWIVRRLKRAIDFDPASMLIVTNKGTLLLRENLPAHALKFVGISVSNTKTRGEKSDTDTTSFSIRHRDSYGELLSLMAKMNGIAGAGPPDNPGTSDATRERVLGAIRKRVRR